MRRIVIPLVVVLLLVALGGGGWWYLSTHPQAQGQLVSELGLQAAGPAHGLAASGFVEATEVIVSSEVEGRIRAMHGDEGDEVAAGQVLVELDTDLLQARIAQAEAALRTAQANLAQVKAGARAQEIAAAEHAVQAAKAQQTIATDAVSAAEANLASATAGLATAQAALDQARSSQAKLLKGATQFEIDQAKQAIDMAKDQLYGAQAQRDAVGAIKGDARQYGEGQYEAAQAEVLVAQVAVDQAQSRYEQLRAGATAQEKAIAQAQVQAAEAQVKQAEAQVQVVEAQAEQARGQVEAAQAAVAQAEDNLALLKAGATPEQIAIAEAQVAEAQAAVDGLKVQMDKTILRAPRSGLITSRTAHQGETAAPGEALLTVADLDTVTLRVYIPETEIGRVRVGQPVQVTVDSFPGRVFDGQVVYIASQAEFTPKNVQTQEERVKLVFGVKVRIPNPDHALKPGVPADAVIEE
jgi:HlyD family secretion protein